MKKTAAESVLENTKPMKHDFLFGNDYNKKRLNIKSEFKKLEKNPLLSVLKKINSEEISIFRDDLSRQDESYKHYFLTLERCLKHTSISIRYHNSAYYKRKNRQRLTPAEKKIAIAYDKSARYFELDFFNNLIHARILLDRIVFISRFFLKDGYVPSFTSFNDHKKFFRKNSVINHDEYANYIKNNTDWFDFPLKAIRDKFITHASPKHVMHFGFPGVKNTDLCLMIVLADNPEGDLRKVKIINVSLVTLYRDIHKFMDWYASYLIKVL